MRNFWKEKSRQGLEHYLSTAVSEDTRYCHAFKQIPQLQQNSLPTQYQAAEMRIFEAAAAPVDKMRYKTENTDLKKLRSSAFARREERNKAEIALESRMQKIRPRPGVDQGAAAMG